MKRKTLWFIPFLPFLIIAFFLTACGSIEYQRITSQQVLKIDNDLSGVDREIAKIKAVLLEKRFLEKISDDKKKEIKRQVEIISDVLRNFEKVKIGMKEGELRSLGFDIAAPNIELRSGYKAITSWFGENNPIKPPFYIMGNEITAKEADFLKFLPFRWAYMISLKNGKWNSFWSNKEKKNVVGFDYTFEFMMFKSEKEEAVVVGFRPNGGVVLTTKEEYESKRSKIGNAFKNPFEWIPRP